MKKFYNTPEASFVAIEPEKDVLSISDEDLTYNEPDENSNNYGNISFRP